jgi:hypothetical protein
VKRNGPARSLEISRRPPETVPEGLPMRALDDEEDLF